MPKLKYKDPKTGVWTELQMGGEVDLPTILNKVYPIGSVYISINNTNPSTLFGGTWTQLKDRFLLGVGDTYKTVNTTGGNSTITLSAANLPAHTHSIGSHTHTYAKANGTTGSHTLTINEMPKHSHKYTMAYGNTDPASGFGYHTLNVGIFGSETSDSFIKMTGGSKGHTHTIGTTNTNTGSAGSGNTGSTGSGTAVNIMPPYLTVYMWQRTA